MIRLEIINPGFQEFGFSAKNTLVERKRIWPINMRDQTERVEAVANQLLRFPNIPCEVDIQIVVMFGSYGLFGIIQSYGQRAQGQALEILEDVEILQGQYCRLYPHGSFIITVKQIITIRDKRS